jgi:hypothetical protein
MGRERCMMVEEFSGKLYCGYYDIFYMLCEENQDCPEELDDDDDDDDEYIEDDEITDFNEY